MKSILPVKKMANNPPVYLNLCHALWANNFIPRLKSYNLVLQKKFLKILFVTKIPFVQLCTL